MKAAAFAEPDPGGANLHVSASDICGSDLTAPVEGTLPLEILAAASHKTACLNERVDDRQRKPAVMARRDTGRVEVRR